MSFRLLAASLLALVFLSLPANAEIVRWARSGDAATLDPHAAGDAMSLQLNRNIYEPLVERQADGTLSGRLAVSWSVKAGEPSVWVFNLRPGVTFHDGSAFGADDVIFSFKRAGATNSAVAAKLAGITNVRAVDDMTVEITLDRTSPVFPAGLSDILIMDKDWAEAHGVAAVKKPGVGDESFSTRNANGTGPYRLQSRDPDVRTALVANDKYWSASRPAASEIIYLPIVNPAMQATALIRSEIDVLQDVAVADIKRIREADGLRVETAPANDVLYLGYRLGAPAAESASEAKADPLDNAKVREAIELAVDRDKAAEMADRGYDTAAATLTPPFIYGRPARSPGNMDRERAKALLAEAGYPDGFAVTFDAPRGDAAVANRIASMLAGIGIWAEVTARTRDAHDAYVASGKSDMYLSDFAAPDYDSASVLAWLTGGYGYENPALEARIDGLDAIENKAERDAAIASIWEAVEKEHVVLPVARRVMAHAMREHISVDIDPNGQTRFETIRVGE